MNNSNDKTKAIVSYIIFICINIFIPKKILVEILNFIVLNQ